MHIHEQKDWPNFTCNQANITVLLAEVRYLQGREGKLTSSKWAKITKCSQDTALRDINDLLERKILIKDEAGGRSTSYHL